MKREEIEKDFKHVSELILYEDSLDKQLETLSLLLKGVQILRKGIIDKHDAEEN